MPINWQEPIQPIYWVTPLLCGMYGTISKILIGIPSVDNPITNLQPKNCWNRLQPPEIEPQGLVPIKSPSWPHTASRYPGQIHQWLWACHKSLKSSRIASNGYANICTPNQTIWWLEASKAIQRCPWFAYILWWDENFWHWVNSYTSLVLQWTPQSCMMHIFEPLRTCTMYFSTHLGHSWIHVS